MGKLKVIGLLLACILVGCNDGDKIVVEWEL